MSEYRVQWTGSRDWPSARLVHHLGMYVRYYAQSKDLRTVFAHGGAKGVDSFAGWSAHVQGIEPRVWLPDWEQHGNRAGILRNEQMIDEFQPHIGIGLNWNNSNGTRNAVTYMKNKGIPMLSIEYTGDPEGKFFPF